MKLTTLALLLLAFLCSAFAQPPVAWETSFGGNKRCWFEGIVSTPDNRLMVAGSIAIGTSNAIWIMNVNANGDSIWSHNMLGEGIVHSMIRGNQNEYVVAGDRPANNVSHAMICILDSMGSQRYYTAFSGSRASFFRDVAKTRNGEYVAAGAFDNGESYSNYEFYITRWDEILSPLWGHTLHGGLMDDQANAVCETPSGQLVVGGGDGGTGSARIDIADSLGIRLGYFNFWQTEHSSANDLILLNDGGWIIVGGPTHPFLMCCLSNGSIRWAHTYRNTSGGGNKFHILPDGGYVIAGQTGGYGVAVHPLVLRTDSIGNLKWLKEFVDIPAGSNFNDIEVLSDGSLVCVGTRQMSYGLPNGLIVKICSETSDGGTVDAIGQQNADWAFRLRHIQGQLSQVSFSHIPQGTRGRVSGIAVANWSSLPNGDGNDGDSVIFRSNIALTYGVLDTFWLTEMDDRCMASWNVHCTRDTAFLEHSGHVTFLNGGEFGTAYRLNCDTGSLRRLVFPNVLYGTTGHVSGAAGAQWTVPPNGDGNDGDSVIFIASTPLSSGVLDTFWLNVPSPQCSVAWSAGCANGMVLASRSHLDSISFSGAWYIPGIDLTVKSWGETDVGTYEILGRRYGYPDALLDTVNPVNDGGFHEYHVSMGPIFRYSFLLAIRDMDGCLYKLEDRLLILGRNVGTDQMAMESPLDFMLSAFPNPFNPLATLSFALPHAAHATLTVYDVTGREIQVLHDGFLDAGEHRFTFNGSSLPTGLYFACLHSGNLTQTTKLLLLK
jgi:hypothetical protein